MELQTLQSSVYSHELLSHMHQLFCNDQLCDLAVQTRDRIFNVHKIVITAASRYFKSMYDTGNLQGPSYVLHTLEGDSAERLFEFMYTGCLTLNNSNAWTLLEGASSLDMPQAVDLCHEYLKQARDNTQHTDTQHNVNLSQVKLENVDDDGVSTNDLVDDNGLDLLLDDGDKDKYFKQNKHIPAVTDSKISTSNLKITINSKTKTVKNVNSYELGDDTRTSNVTSHTPVKRGRGRPRKDQKHNRVETVAKKAKKDRKQRNRNRDKSDRVKRFRNLRSEKRTHSCKSCKASFYLRSSLALHRSLLRHNNYRNCSYWNIVKSRLCVLHKHSIKLLNKQDRFMCPWKNCDVSFKEFRKLTAHIQCTHYKYHCKLCHRKVSGSLRHFVRMHLFKWDSRRKLYKCGLCSRIFMYKRTLKSHYIMSHLVRSKKAKLKKVLLQTTRPKRKEVVAEIEYEWKPKPLWKCEDKTCRFVASGRKSLMCHMNSDHPDMLFECRNCSFETPLRRDLERHLKYHHIKIDDRKCDECGRIFSKPLKMKMHKFLVHKIKEPGVNVFECDFEGCDYACIDVSMLRKHQVKHDSDRRFTCNECGKQLKTPITLEKHINKVHKGIKPFMCEICGVSYGEESELKIHINRHGDTKSFFCDLCEYSAYDKGNFKSHLFNKHKIKLNENMKTFSCNICNYITDVKYRYTDHMRVHLNQRDIQCPECDKCFMTRKALRGHHIKVHKPKNLHCDFCGYATADVSKLKEHIRIMHTHRNFKPYKCAYCTFTCATGGNCRKHVMLKHRGQPVKVEKLVDKMPAINLNGTKQELMQESMQEVAMDASFEELTGVREDNSLLQEVFQQNKIQVQADFEYNHHNNVTIGNNNDNDVTVTNDDKLNKTQQQLSTSTHLLTNAYYKDNNPTEQLQPHQLVQQLSTGVVDMTTNTYSHPHQYSGGAGIALEQAQTHEGQHLSTVNVSQFQLTNHGNVKYDTSHQLSTPMTSDKQHRLTDQQQSQQHVISKAPPYFTVTAPGNTTVDNLIKRQLLDTRQFVSINAASLLEPYQLVLGSQLTTNQSTHHSGNT